MVLGPVVEVVSTLGLWSALSAQRLASWGGGFDATLAVLALGSLPFWAHGLWKVGGRKNGTSLEESSGLLGYVAK